MLYIAKITLISFNTKEIIKIVSIRDAVAFSYFVTMKIFWIAYGLILIEVVLTKPQLF